MVCGRQLETKYSLAVERVVGLMSAMQTMAPRDAKSFAVAKPIPDAPPVMAITLPWSGPSIGMVFADMVRNLLGGLQDVRESRPRRGVISTNSRGLIVKYDMNDVPNGWRTNSN